MYDIIIIGAGPAGSTLARLLDEKYRVLIVDRRNLDDSSDYMREKCCGGLLAPAAQKSLAKQGLGVPGDILTGPQTFSVRSVDCDNNLTRYYQRHYINISREKFDRWLVSLIPDSVNVFFNCIYKSFKENSGFYIVNLEKDGSPIEARAKILIGTDGAQSRVRDQAFEGMPMPDKYISIQEHYKASGKIPYYVSLFNKKITNFYSWVIQKNGELLVGSAFPKEIDADKNFGILIAELRDLGYIKGKALKRTGTIIMRPKKLRQLNIYKGNIALAGEAAGLISPSSAEGISYALESGRILANNLNKALGDFGAKYDKSLAGIKLNLIFKGIKVRLMYNKFTRGLIMKSRIFSMDVDNREISD